MYTLKSIVQRGSLFGATAALVVAAVAPAAAVFADALNPLTERSLLLSSSAPGWQDTDGSNYSTANPNPGQGFNGTPSSYAPAGSGPNGKKSGEAFTFRTSSSGAIAGFSLQYCTTAAGKCVGPGNNTGDADPDKDGDTSDSTRLANETPTTGGWDTKKSDLDVTGAFTETTAALPKDMPAGTFGVYIGGTLSTGWSFGAVNKEDADSTDAKTGKKNYLTLTNAGGSLPTTAGGTQVQVFFKASETQFITNPGAGAFFVKINTWDSDDTADFVPGNAHNIDGGVTVANVMTDSIHITTKVLETMAFSVGTQNPDTQVNGGNHGTCDVLTQLDNNRLNLGNPMAEYSLETGKAWDVNSYWRLSSNSSGGASVYYSGDTLSNTMGDQIADMPNEVPSLPGTEQFGLGFVDAGLDTMDSVFAGLVTSEPTKYFTPRSYPFITLSTQTGAPYNTLAAQPASTGYDEATGTIDDGAGHAGTAKFKFLKTSSTVPEMIAQQTESVISCATAKMRYVGNIAADTPAGVYTTKINYLAAPQY